jgi:hypothetical protein
MSTCSMAKRFSCPSGTNVRLGRHSKTCDVPKSIGIFNSKTDMSDPSNSDINYVIKYTCDNNVPVEINLSIKHYWILGIIHKFMNSYSSNLLKETNNNKYGYTIFI